MRETAERESVVNPDAAARVRRMCAEFGERNYSMSDDTVVHPRGLHVDCPNTVCGAKRGDPCKHPTRRVTGFVHPSRQDAEQKYIQEHK